MGRNDREALKTLLSEEGEKVVYRSTKQEVKQVFCDGAYHSVSNQEFSDTNNIDLVITGIQGAVPRYDPEMTSEEIKTADLRRLLVNRPNEVLRIKNLIESTYQRTQKTAHRAIQRVFPSDFPMEKSPLIRIFRFFRNLPWIKFMWAKYHFKNIN